MGTILKKIIQKQKQIEKDKKLKEQIIYVSSKDYDDFLKTGYFKTADNEK